MLSLGATVLIMVMANTMLLPIFPAMRGALNLTLAQVSLLIVAVNIPAALLSPVGGFLADLWGRKIVMVPSLIIYGAGGALAGIGAIISDNPFTIIIIGRILQGIGSASPMFLAITLAGDIFQSAERTQAVGLMETSSGLGKISGPIIGAAAGTLLWQLPFFVYPLVSIPIAAAVYWMIREPPPEKPSPDVYREIPPLIGKKINLIGFAAAFVSLYTLLGLMFWLSETLEQKIEAAAIIKGVIISLPVISFLLTTLLSEWFYNHLRVKFTLLLGVSVISISIGIIPFVYHTVLIWLTIIVAGVGVGLVMPAIDTISTSIISVRHRGIVSTVYGSVRSLGAAAGPFVFARLMEIGTGITFWTNTAAVIAIAAAILIFFNESDIPKKLKSPES